jgi:predicted 3-demethylubiquinone-9 3-methyltransferase (glyoxalase superfamily)
MSCRKSCPPGGKTSKVRLAHDKYGVSWQIIPTALRKMLSDPNPGKSKNVMQAMLQMDETESTV